MEDETLPGLKVGYNPKGSFDYEDCLTRAICPHCSKSLEWKLAINSENDDRFCSAVCCSTKFSMVPDKVRVISVFPDDNSGRIDLRKRANCIAYF